MTLQGQIWVLIAVFRTMARLEEPMRRLRLSLSVKLSTHAVEMMHGCVPHSLYQEVCLAHKSYRFSHFITFRSNVRLILRLSTRSVGMYVPCRRQTVSRQVAPLLSSAGYVLVLNGTHPVKPKHS